MTRMFRVRVRPNRLASLGVSASPGEIPPSARGGEEVVVAEEVAASLIRLHAVEVIEIIENGEGEPAWPKI